MLPLDDLYLLVILSEAKDLLFAARSRSFASLRMTNHFRGVFKHYNFLRHSAPAALIPALTFSRSGRAYSRSRKLSISPMNPLPYPNHQIFFILATRSLSTYFTRTI